MPCDESQPRFYTFVFWTGHECPRRHAATAISPWYELCIYPHRLRLLDRVAQASDSCLHVINRHLLSLLASFHRLAQFRLSRVIRLLPCRFGPMRQQRSGIREPAILPWQHTPLRRASRPISQESTRPEVAWQLSCAIPITQGYAGQHVKQQVQCTVTVN